MDLSSVAIPGPGGITIGVGFLDPAQVIGEALSFPLFWIDITKTSMLPGARFLVSVVYIRARVCGRAGVFAAPFSFPGIDVLPSPAFGTVV